MSGAPERSRLVGRLRPSLCGMVRAGASGATAGPILDGHAPVRVVRMVAPAGPRGRMTAEEWTGVPEAARLAGVGVTTVRRLAAAGRLELRERQKGRRKVLLVRPSELLA